MRKRIEKTFLRGFFVTSLDHIMNYGLELSSSTHQSTRVASNSCNYVNPFSAMIQILLTTHKDSLWKRNTTEFFKECCNLCILLCTSCHSHRTYIRIIVQSKQSQKIRVYRFPQNVEGYYHFYSNHSSHMCIQWKNQISQNIVPKPLAEAKAVKA